MVESLESSLEKYTLYNQSLLECDVAVLKANTRLKRLTSFAKIVFASRIKQENRKKNVERVEYNVNML